jgi:broad specificity phosphatase PhoE
VPTLLLVRHGQASIHADNYDVLSELGHRQATALGQYFARTSRRIDRVVSGPLERQRDTTTRLLEASGRHDLVPTVLDGLREFPAFSIVDRVKEKVAERDEVVRRGLVDAAAPGKGGRAAPGFRDGVERIATLWANGELDDVDDLESFAAFKARVLGALDEVAEQLASRQTGVLVTSGGVIAVAVADALGLPPARAMELMWEIANGSFHEIRLRPHTRTLMRFNAIPHLEPDGMVTHV